MAMGFGTPVVSYPWPESEASNREPAALIPEKATRTVTLARERPRTFKYRINGWANTSRHGAYDGVCNQPNCLWSGTDDVQPGEPDEEHPQNGKGERISVAFKNLTAEQRAPKT